MGDLTKTQVVVRDIRAVRLRSCGGGRGCTTVGLTLSSILPESLDTLESTNASPGKPVQFSQYKGAAMGRLIIITAAAPVECHSRWARVSKLHLPREPNPLEAGRT